MDTSADYYVSLQGDDNNVGSEDQPFRTIARGVRALQGGQKLRIFGGLYTESCIGSEASIAIASGTSWEEATVITNYPGEEVVFRTYGKCAFHFNNAEQYVILDGLVLEGLGDASTQDSYLLRAGNAHHLRFANGAIRYSSAVGALLEVESHHIEVVNSSIHNNGSLKIIKAPPSDNVSFGGVLLGASDSILHDNQIYQNLGKAVQVYSVGAKTHRCVLQKNNIHHNFVDAEGYDTPAVYVASGANHQVIGNTFDSEQTALSVTYGSVDALVENNTISNMRKWGIYVGNQAVRTVVRFNTITNVPDSKHIVLENGGTAIVSDNILN